MLKYYLFCFFMVGFSVLKKNGNQHNLLIIHFPNGNEGGILKRIEV